MKIENAARRLANERRRSVRPCLECGQDLYGIALALRHPACKQRAKLERRKARMSNIAHQR